jgi:sugar/nucleoside kinase (ribokinase family)
MFMRRIFLQFPNAHVTVVSSYGDDFQPYLKDVTIYPENPIISRTLMYENFSVGNTRFQKALHREESRPVPISKELREIIEKADVIIVSPILPDYSPDYIRRLLVMANPGSVKLLIPQGYFRNFKNDGIVIPRKFIEADTLLPLFDFVTVSAEDYPQLGNLSRHWVANSGVQIIMTQGSRGATIFSRSGEKQISTEQVPLEKIIDTVGSGDIFSAGFIYECSITKNVESAVCFANKLAGACLAFTPDKIQFDYTKIHES